jgi:hypothetical protein
MMYSKSCACFILVLGVLCIVVPFVRAADIVFRQPSPAKIVSVEEVTSTEQPSMSYAVGQIDGTIPATVIAVNQETNTARVLTQEGQTIVVELSAESLADMQVGDRLKLVVFQRP